MAGYSLELDLQDSRLRPFAVYAKSEITHDGVKFGASCVCRKACVVEATGRFDSLSNHLHLSVGKGRHVVSQKIDACVTGACLIGIQELLSAGEHHPRNRLPIFVVHKSVEQRAECGFHSRVLRTDHAAANHLRPESMAVDGSHQTDRVSEVGAEKEQIAITLGDGVDDGREILGRQRIAGFMDDLEVVLPGIGLRAENGIAREFGVR